MTDTATWHSDTPQEHGMEKDRLDALWSDLQQRASKSLLILRHGRIVYEAYADDWDQDKPHYSASMAKALVGGLSLALAMDDGLIGPDDLAAQYIPQWRDDPQKGQITIRQLATHTSGIEDAELSAADIAAARQKGDTTSPEHMELPGWKGGFWRQDPDPFTLARDQAPVVFAPGSQYTYSNPGIGLLTYAVTASLQGTAWPDVRSLLAQRLMEPLGLGPDEWSIGYGKTFTVDGLPLVASWGGGSFTARATARLGQLLVQRGQWQGRQLIGPVALAQILAYAGMPVPTRDDGQPWPGSGLGFWVNTDGVWEGVPTDAVAGAGAGDQTLLVVPSLDLVAVRNGGSIDPDSKFGWGARMDYLFAPLMKAFTLQAPYPSSPVIAAIDWAPVAQISRAAMGGKTRDGSDNWPMTWAGDDQLYTAYGDGFGFEPGVEKKLGMGLAVVMGGPTDYSGFNIRYDAENEGYGPNGEKSSGLLALDNKLYMWVRNANQAGQHSRLGWSVDRGRHWQWCDWLWEEFGHPAFVNYGREYAGARDDFVYIVSHDDPSAYKMADHFVLLRVPKEALREKERYEFFRGLDGEGEPQWSGDIADRRPVFTHANQCRRSSISYNAGLGRYLWWQQLTGRDSTDTRFAGGFGLFDAPEPWGPWATTFFTEQWDVGPGDLACFPTKWMSNDGRTVQLVFAGQDHFAVRRGDVRLREGAGK
ncbi:MAG: serine hydrolase [Candidatus Latescibacteria bacterium]|nr:serine hydrolase [Candidatus Latescibacterota bacterium]